jgi:hypothetical protein
VVSYIDAEHKHVGYRDQGDGADAEKLARESLVNQANTSIAERISELSEVIDLLAKRLEPVLSPPHPVESAPKIADDGDVAAPLTYVLRKHVDRIVEVRMRVENVLSRLLDELLTAQSEEYRPRHGFPSKTIMRARAARRAREAAGLPHVVSDLYVHDVPVAHTNYTPRHARES